MQTGLGRKTVAALTALTMALALFGVVSMPKKAYAAESQMTVTVTLPATVSNADGAVEVSFSTYDLNGTVDAGTWANMADSAAKLSTATVTAPVSAIFVIAASTTKGTNNAPTTFTAAWTPTNDGPYVIGAQIIENDGVTALDTTSASNTGIEYGVQSVIVKKGGTAAALAFHDYKATATTDNPGASTTVTATIPQGLTLYGGAPLVDFGNVAVGSDYSKTSDSMRVVSSVTKGYTLQAQTSTASGEMGLDGVTNATATEFIPWGNALATAATSAKSAWHVAFKATAQTAANDDTLVQAPFTSLDATGGTAPNGTSAVTVATSANETVKITGDDEYAPTYGLALQSAQVAGTYATTVTYTLVAVA